MTMNPGGLANIARGFSGGGGGGASLGLTVRLGGGGGGFPQPP